jgi:hypothetical protein
MPPHSQNSKQRITPARNPNRAQGKYADAEPLYQQAIAICVASLPADHPQPETIRKNYARMQAERDKG